MTRKDYSLLRPFDLEAAKAGGLMCERTLAKQNYTYVDGPDKSGWIVCNNENDVFVFVSKDHAKVAPLCWVEGKPVYPGDALEHTRLGEVVAKSEHANKEILVVEKYDGLAVENLTWPRPKPVKRWINIYPANSFESQDSANEYAASSRIACIEIELPPIKP